MVAKRVLRKNEAATTAELLKAKTPNSASASSSQFWSNVEAREKELLQSIGLHLFEMSAVQDRLFGVCGDENTPSGNTYRNFSDFSYSAKLHRHSALFRAFADCFEKAPPQSALSIHAQWTLHRLSENTLRAANRDTLKRQLMCAKLVAALCFLEGHYYEALQCVLYVVGIDQNEHHCWYLLFRWLLWLDEWDEVGKTLLNRAKRALNGANDAYAQLLDAVELIRSMHSLASTRNYSEEADSIVEQLTELFAEVTTTMEQQTYFSAQLEMLVKEALVMASRLPFADLQKIGDPLQNRCEQLETCDLILRSRFPAFFDRQTSRSTLQMKATNPEEFLKVCACVAEYMETLNSLAIEFLEVGLTREVEAHCVSAMKYALPLGIPCRIIRPAVMLIYEKSMLKLEEENFPSYLAMIYSLFKPRTTSTQLYLPGVKVDQSSGSESCEDQRSAGALTPSTVPSGDTLVNDSLEDATMSDYTLREDNDDVVDALCGNMRQHLRINNNILNGFSPANHNYAKQGRRQEAHEDSDFELFVLTATEVLNGHVERCPCGLCSFLNSNAQFALHHAWLRLIEARYSPSVWEIFKTKFDRAASTVAKERDVLMAQITGKTPENPSSTYHVVIPFLVWLWLRTSIKVGMMWSTALVDWILWANCANSQLNSIKICFRNKLRYRGDLLLLRHLSRTTNNKDIEEAYYDQQNFSHLFFREWRSQNYEWLATATDGKHGLWHKARYWVETAVPCVRQYARMVNQRKRSAGESQATIEDDHAVYQYESGNDIMEAVHRLPEGFTLINLAMDRSGSLVVTRLHPNYEPVIVRIGRVSKGRQAMETLRCILAESEESTKMPAMWDLKSAEKFWRIRRDLDERMKVLVGEMQDIWLGALAPLFMPLPSSQPEWMLPALEILREKFTTVGFPDGQAELLSSFISILDEKNWCALMRELGKINGIEDYWLHKITRSWLELIDVIDVARHKEEEKSRRPAIKRKALPPPLSTPVSSYPTKSYVLLVVPPALNIVPWECLPLFNKVFVTRTPSLHIFENLYRESKKVPKAVDARKSYYVLNPGGDLGKMQDRLITFMGKFNWTGLVGQIPTREQFQDALESNDLFLYMGHGSGGRYFGRSSIRESRCKAVSILMGCGSARVNEEGPDFDGRSSVYEYLVAKCPCVIGCLWTVTDGEIDRFFMALVDSCFSQFAKKLESSGNRQTTPVGRGCKGKKAATPATPTTTTARKDRNFLPENFKVEASHMLIQGIVQARKACRLPYLTGGSVASFGLPISSLLPTPSPPPMRSARKARR